MRVLLREHDYPHLPGAVIEVDDERGQNLVRRGFAVSTTAELTPVAVEEGAAAEATEKPTKPKKGE